MSPEISYLKVEEWGGLAVLKEFLRKPHSGFFSILDADKIVSFEQVQICYSKALKLVESTPRIKMPESAFLMLLSGRNQISRAQAEVGVSSSTKSILAVYDSLDEFSALKESCGMCVEERDNIPIPATDRAMDTEIFSRMARVQLAL